MDPINHETFMLVALEQARLSKTSGELPFGAAIIKDGAVLALGRCQEAELQTVLAHAEASAVDRACRKLQTTKLSDCTIYCTNEPCPMCAAAIFQAKIPNVVIGASRADIPSLRPRKIDLEALANDSGYPITITRAVMRAEVLKLFA